MLEAQSHINPQQQQKQGAYINKVIIPRVEANF
jgi:hypothetical protein